MEEANQILEKAYKMRVHNLPEAIKLANQVMQTGVEKNDLRIVAKAKTSLGLFYMILGEFQKSIDLSNEAIQFFSNHNDTRGLANAKYNIGSVYYKTSNFHLGLEYLLDCLSIYRELKDFHNEARVLKSIGTIYEYFGDEENAVASYEGSIEAARNAYDRDAETNAFSPLSGIYLKRGDWDKAYQLANDSIRIKEETGDVRGLAFSVYAMAKVWHKKGEIEKAMSFYQESLRLNQASGDRLGESMAFNKIGFLFYELGDYHQANVNLQKALAIAQSYQIQVMVFKAYYNQYLVAKKLGNVTDAIFFLERYLEEKNTVINTHTHNVIKSYRSLAKIQLLESQAIIQKEKAEITERKNAELDSFFYRVSHDLKGPISSLMGLNDLVKVDIMDQESARYFEMYQSQIRRINKIIMDLIDLTQMNNKTVRLVRIDFQTLINECIHSYTYLENFKRINFTVDVGSDIEYYTEWGVINTVLQNLIENAIKYSRPVPEAFVKVSVTQNSNSIAIHVEDNGQGIHPQHQARIFEMFYRAHDNVKGSGLGLYILKRAVERLLGEISFKSEFSKGTRFTITLPIQNVPQQAT